VGDDEPPAPPELEPPPALPPVDVDPLDPPVELLELPPVLELLDLPPVLLLPEEPPVEPGPSLAGWQEAPEKSSAIRTAPDPVASLRWGVVPGRRRFTGSISHLVVREIVLPAAADYPTDQWWRNRLRSSQNQHVASRAHTWF
jgi:hypothetical protein